MYKDKEGMLHFWRFSANLFGFGTLTRNCCTSKFVWIEILLECRLYLTLTSNWPVALRFSVPISCDLSANIDMTLPMKWRVCLSDSLTSASTTAGVIFGAFDVSFLWHELTPLHGRQKSAERREDGGKREEFYRMWYLAYKISNVRHGTTS